MESPVGRLNETFRSIVDRAGAKLVFGDPVSEGGRTIVPVASVRYGFGSGSGEGRRGERQGGGGGGGGGLFAKPVGVVEVTATQTRFIPITSSGTFLAAVALGVAIGWLAAPKQARMQRR